MLIEGTCTSGGGFLRRACGAPPVGQCVYCGEPFCERHGELGADHHEVCSRSSCRTRYADVQRHLAWVAQCRPRNDISMCAEDGCMERMAHQCQRCHLRFCEAHMRASDIVDRLQHPPRRMRLLMCGHCIDRRRIWN